MRMRHKEKLSRKKSGKERGAKDPAATEEEYRKIDTLQLVFLTLGEHFVAMGNLTFMKWYSTAMKWFITSTATIYDFWIRMMAFENWWKRLRYFFFFFFFFFLSFFFSSFFLNNSILLQMGTYNSRFFFRVSKYLMSLGDRLTLQ